MNSSSSAAYRFCALVGVLLVAHAAYWFIGGRSADATGARTAAVIGQIVVGLALAVWAGDRSRSREAGRHRP